MDCFPYPELYAVVGSRVPDYQGMFLRGYGGNAAGLGVQQGDAIRNIYGDIGNFRNDASICNYYSGAFQYARSGYSYTGYSDTAGMVMKFNASYVVPTASENRPVNKAVRYLIRAKS